MLVSWSWWLAILFVRSFNPIPPSVSMSSQPPGVCNARRIHSSSSKDNHHASCATCLAQSSRVVSSHRWTLLSAIQFYPRKWGLFNTQTPHITAWLLTYVPTKHEQVRLWKHYTMSISPAWSGPHDWHDHPLSDVLSMPHVEQVEVVTSHATPASGSAVHDHLHGLHVRSGVSSSGRRRHSLDAKFLPRLSHNVEHVGFSRHRVFSGVTCGATEEHHLGFWN